jgi:hypothetical protein
MNLKVGDKKKIVEFLLVFAIIVVLLLIVYFVVYEDIFLIFTRECEDKECFDANLARCRRARYVSEVEEASWIFTIRGKEKGNCEIDVELANVKQGDISLSSAVGKQMTCYLPLNSITVPGDDLSLCTGPLKEEMQDLIIKKMHAYILENLGQINEELRTV